MEARKVFHKAVMEAKVEVVKRLLARAGDDDESIEDIATAVAQMASPDWQP